MPSLEDYLILFIGRDWRALHYAWQATTILLLTASRSGSDFVLFINFGPV